MAQNDTYQTNVYHAHDGATFVFGSNAQLVIESGASILINSVAGTLVLESGATLSMTSGGVLGLAGQNLAIDDLRRMLVSEQAGAAVTIIPSAAAVSLSVQNENLPANARYVTIQASDTVISGSFWLTSVSAGREVILRLVGDLSGGFAEASCQIDVSTSGCIILDSVGAAVSGFEMHTSAASDCMVHLLAVLDNTWAIINQYGDINT